MKSNMKAIADVNTLNAFNAERELSMVMRELFALSGVTDKIESNDSKVKKLNEQIEKIKTQIGGLKEETKPLNVDKTERLKRINALIKDLYKNGIRIHDGSAGGSKCPYRNQVKALIADSGLAKKTTDKMLSAIVYAVNNGKSYDVHWDTKLAQQRKIEEARQQGIEQGKSDKPSDNTTTPPATPSTTTPSTTTPSTTTPSTTTPSTTTPNANNKSLDNANLMHWTGAKFEALRQIHGDVKKRASSSDGDRYRQDFDDLIASIDDAMDLLKSIADREIELHKNK